MKKLILGAILLFSMSISAQDVYLTSNTTYGNNCGQQSPEQRTIGTLYLQGFTLDLRNTDLNITNRVVGPGEIDFCGNRNNPSSSLCVANGIDSNVLTNNLVCRTLSLQDYDFTNNIDNLSYTVYDIQGKVISRGVTSNNTFNILPENKLILVKIEGYNTLKVYKD